MIFIKDINGIYPLVNLQKAIENGPVEIVDFPMKHGGSFHSHVNVYQRVLTILNQQSSIV